MWKVILLALPLAGCITTEDRAALDAIAIDSSRNYTYDRGRIDAINAEIACKNMARTLVQMARCEVRGR